MDIRMELEFWTGIMRDHAQMHYVNLSVNEPDAIEVAKSFLDVFTVLNSETKTMGVEMVVPNIMNFIQRNKDALMQFIEFKKILLRDLLQCKIELGMEPTFINHQINEACEFLMFLEMIEKGYQYEIDPVKETLRLHTIWLPDASGHAKAIASNLDGVEANYINIANDFIDVFDKLFKKAHELKLQIERTDLKNGNVDQLNQEVEIVITDFIAFLDELENLRANCKIMATGTTSEMIFNHMKREEKYYLEKIKEL